MNPNSGTAPSPSLVPAQHRQLQR